ncbi:OsmC family protein [Parvibaculum sedimenti]|nr:OsmC family protein [Parvibaculum sedimenti]
MRERSVTVSESGNGPYGEFITAGHHVLGADERETVGGQDTGPDPYEILLSALGACTAMTLRMYAARHQWPVEHIEVRLRYVRRAVGADGPHDRFERVIEIKGEFSDEQRARLLEIADRCPVSQTLQRSSEIATSLAE